MWSRRGIKVTKASVKQTVNNGGIMIVKTTVKSGPSTDVCVPCELVENEQ